MLRIICGAVSKFLVRTTSAAVEPRLDKPFSIVNAKNNSTEGATNRAQDAMKRIQKLTEIIMQGLNRSANDPR
ncbi:hypothetical protein D3C80_1116930 [compost metagenome]